uniref:HAP1 N-terminal domain-containing protein n=1 Tax=Macrostomum lignano TaxID=282301 RepID=A0A1I8FKU4_9PLAT
SSRRHLPDEISSLSSMLELRNAELADLRRRLAESDEELQALRDTRERNALLQRRLENLEAVVAQKTENEKLSQPGRRAGLLRAEGRGGGSSGAEDSDSAAGSSLMSRSMYVPSSGGTSGGGGGSGGAARRRGLQHDRNKRRTISTAGDGGARDSAVVAAAAAAFSAALMDGDDNE